MHHRAVILSAEHAPDDGVGVAKQFAAQVHGKLAGLHEIRAALLTEDFLGRDAAVLTDDTDDELRGQRGAVAALPHDVEQILFGKIAAEQGCLLSPVGTAFYDVNTNHPEVVLYTEDNSHPTLSGSYLAALCHFAVLYGVSPLSVPYTPAGVEPEEAAILKQAAADAVSGPSIVPDEYRL